MISTRRLLLPILSLLAILLSESPAPAATLTQTKMVPLRTTGFTDSSSLTFDKFNIANSQIDSIEFQFSGHIEGGVRQENQSESPRTLTTFIGATLTLRRPDNAILLNLSPRATTSDNLTAFDGTLDFLGTSGVIHNNLVADQSGSTTLVGPSVDLNQFIGPGTFTLVLLSVTDSGYNVGADQTTIFNGLTSAQVTVITNYTTIQNPPIGQGVVPEPSSFALLGIGGGFTLAVGYCKRRSRRKVA